jgi:hypothetical protein
VVDSFRLLDENRRTGMAGGRDLVAGELTVGGRARGWSGLVLATAGDVLARGRLDGCYERE